MMLNDVVRYGADTNAMRHRLLSHTRVVGHHRIWKHPHRDDGEFYITRKEIRPLPRQVHLKGKKVSARRLMYLLSNGEIPDGMNVKRVCDHPGCINPEHLALDRNVKVTNPNPHAVIAEVAHILDDNISEARQHKRYVSITGYRRD